MATAARTLYVIVPMAMAAVEAAEAAVARFVSWPCRKRPGENTSTVRKSETLHYVVTVAEYRSTDIDLMRGIILRGIRNERSRCDLLGFVEL